MTDKKPGQKTFQLTEDWLAVIIAFGLMLLAALGLLGDGGIPIQF